MSKRVLITGASSGFDQLTALTLSQQGHQVAAALRDPYGRNAPATQNLKASGCTVIEIDVTDESSVDTGVQHTIAALGGLDVLINNAGVGVLGFQEFFTPADFQKLFDVNVFGVQRMNRAVIPHLRAQRSGLILYVSSLLGRIALPFYGPYQASKWALEALAESYRVELSTFGIENCIVEPGGFPTPFGENLMRPSDTSQAPSYGEFLAVPDHMLQNFEHVLSSNPQQDPQKVADAMADLIARPVGEKPFRTTVDFIGMGDHIVPYNAALEQIMTGLYGNFGMANLLNVAQ